MSYNNALALRVRTALRDIEMVEEKKMMGGLTFMVKGKMCVGILQDDLMARIAPEAYEAALQKTGCREMDFTGRPMEGFVYVNSRGWSNEASLKKWIQMGIDHVSKLPRKRMIKK